MSRGRIAIALGSAERADLERFAGAREVPPSRLAGEIVAAELARRRAAERPAAGGVPLRAHVGQLGGVDHDIHEALATPGVVGLLLDPGTEQPTGALRALNFLVDISAWLADPRPYRDRPTPPTLARTPVTVRRSGQIRAALEHAGGADGRAVHAAASSGPCSVSDKQQLSDVAAQGHGKEPGGDA